MIGYDVGNAAHADLAERRVGLVYGGGHIGLMGVLADAALAASGEVIGVIPQSLVDKELAHARVTELRIVENMHQRKQLMNDLCDAIIMLPGGFGTLEEFFEVLTWLQLGLHNHPTGILNINGFYDLLLQQMDLMVEQRFLKPANRKLVITSGDPIELITLLEDCKVEPDEVWFRDRNLT